EDGFADEDQYVQQLLHAVRKVLGDTAAACVDARIQMVRGKMICFVSCRRSSSPVFVRLGSGAGGRGDFYVRQGTESVRLSPAGAEAYIRDRFHQHGANPTAESQGR